MRAIFPGTFDPITYGHIDLIKRSAYLFSDVVVAIAKNEKKNPLFSLAKRVEMATDALKDLSNVKIIGFDTLLATCVKEVAAKAIIRGLRIVADFEYELQLAKMNEKLIKNVETIFLPPSLEYSFISSSMIKEVASLNGDVNNFVPPSVLSELKAIYGIKNN